jgi:hypothetical protein
VFRLTAKYCCGRLGIRAAQQYFAGDPVFIADKVPKSGISQYNKIIWTTSRIRIHAAR